MAARCCRSTSACSAASCSELRRARFSLCTCRMRCTFSRMWSRGADAPDWRWWGRWGERGGCNQAPCSERGCCKRSCCLLCCGGGQRGGKERREGGAASLGCRTARCGHPTAILCAALYRRWQLRRRRDPSSVVVPAANHANQPPRQDSPRRRRSARSARSGSRISATALRPALPDGGRLWAEGSKARRQSGAGELSDWRLGEVGKMCSPAPSPRAAELAHLHGDPAVVDNH